MPFFCRWLVLQLLSVTPSQLLLEMHVQHDNACNSILKLTTAKTWHRYIFWNGICTHRIRSWALWFDRPVVHMYKKIANCSLADKCLECCKLASLFNSSNNFSKTCLFSPNTALNLSPCPSSSSWTHWKPGIIARSLDVPARQQVDDSTSSNASDRTNNLHTAAAVFNWVLLFVA